MQQQAKQQQKRPRALRMGAMFGYEEEGGNGQEDAQCRASS